MNEPASTESEVARSAYLALVQDVLLGRFAPDTELVPVPPEELEGGEMHSWPGGRYAEVFAAG